ncbi:hypothetical protein VTN02DRAFT_1261 [Thermoascus thermophilus]
MSRFAAKKGKRLPGAEFTWDTEGGGEPDTAPTPLFPKYNVPHAKTLNPREQAQVGRYQALRERIHDGPYYTVLEIAASAAKKGSAARAQFDPFYGMPSYAERYHKKKRTLPTLSGRPYVLKFFPQELWQTIQPNYKPDNVLDGYGPLKARPGMKRGFEDEDEEDDEELAKRRRMDEHDDEDEVEGEERRRRDEDEEGPLDEEEEQEEDIVDDDFSEDDEEMGGDYNAEQYFDAGDDDANDDGFADGGVGGDEDTY